MVEQEGKTVRMKASTAAAMSVFRPANDIRYYLCGLYVEPHKDGGIIVVATDGHVLGAMRDEEGEAPDGPAIVPVSVGMRGAAKKVATTKNGNNRPQFATWRGGGAFVTATRKIAIEEVSTLSKWHLHAEYAPPIEGDYPDWRSVMNRERSGENLTTVDTRFLSRFDEAARILSADHNCPRALSVTVGGPEEETLVSIPGVDFTGLIMPLHNGNKNAIPGWAKGEKDGD